MSPYCRQLGQRSPGLSAAWRRRRWPTIGSAGIVFNCRPVSGTTAAAAAGAGGREQEKETSSGRPLPDTDWNQFISVAPDGYRKRKLPPGSFRLAVKDNIATSGEEGGSGLPTTCGSGMLRGYVSPFEATIVGQLRARGGFVVGKTNMDEFGMGSHSLYSHFGRVAARSATDAEDSLSVGGSSGGSAVAVRLGDADVALGTDTGGSVRLPAAYGGIVGFKPSYGMLSRFGVVPYANSLDTVGLLAADVAPLRELIVGQEENGGEENEKETGSAAGGLWQEADTGRDPTSLSRPTRLRLAAKRLGYGRGQGLTTMANGSHSSDDASQPPLRGLCFGIPLEYNIAELDPRIRTAWTAAAARLRTLGASVAAVSLPSTRHALSAYYVIAPAEAASNLARYDGVRYGQPGAASNGRPSSSSSSSDGQARDSSGEDDGPVLYERVRGAGLGPEAQQRILLGAFALSSAARDNYFVQAQRVRRLVVRDFDAVFRLPNPLRDNGNDGGDAEADTHTDAVAAIDLSDLPEGLPLADRRGPAQVDFLLCPTAPTPAPRLSDVVAAPSHVEAYMNDVFTVPASLAGLPAISIPAPPPTTTTPAATTAAATTTTFCPGLQLIGQFWDDARLLRVAEILMEASFEQPEDREALQRHRQTGVSGPDSDTTK